jgi:hypothetical protein
MTEVLVADVTSELAAPSVHTINMVFQHFLCLVGFAAVVIGTREVFEASVHDHVDFQKLFLSKDTATFWASVIDICAHRLLVALPERHVLRN